jgi:prepilin-type N-terminal cleavage/methylation domain-containing protein
VLVTRLRRQDGFTLPELMVGLTIGMVVVLAAFTLVDRTILLNDDVTNRVDSSQRGRLAMEQITRQIRSQVCPEPGTPAMVAGTPYSITFHSYTGNVDYDPATQTNRFEPIQQQIAWDTNTNSISRTDLSINDTRVMLSDVIPPKGDSRPVFEYYGWNAAGGVDYANPIATPLTAGTIDDVVMVRIAYTVLPGGRASNASASPANPPKGSTPLTEDVYIRSADPNDLAGPKGPIC